MVFETHSDTRIRSTPSCRFRSYHKRLVDLARAIYLLRLDDGRSQHLIDPARCGFADPHHLYEAPPPATYSIEGEQAMVVNGSIPSSYGIDLIELQFSPSMQGRNLKLVFSHLSDTKIELHVEACKIKNMNENPEFERESVLVTEPNSRQDENGSLILNITNIDETDFDGLGLIITGFDPREEMETMGAYSIQWIAE